MTWIKVFDYWYIKPNEVPRDGKKGIYYGIFSIYIKTNHLLSTDEIDDRIRRSFYEFIKNPSKWLKKACKAGWVKGDIAKFCKHPPPEDLLKAWSLVRGVAYYKEGSAYEYRLDLYAFIYIPKKFEEITKLQVMWVLLGILIAALIGFILFIVFSDKIEKTIAKILKDFEEFIRGIPPKVWTTIEIVAISTAVIAVALLIYKLLKR